MSELQPSVHEDKPYNELERAVKWYVIEAVASGKGVHIWMKEVQAMIDEAGFTNRSEELQDAATDAAVYATTIYGQ